MTPYLLVFEPTGVRTRSLQGPRMRRPPLLPVHKEATDTASATPAPHQAALPANAHISESVLSSDPLVPPISVAKAPTAPATQEPAAVERVDNAITPAKGQDPELKDAAIYFETPIGARGARVTIPVPAASSPTTHAQPESSASYQQKE